VVKRLSGFTLRKIHQQSPENPGTNVPRKEKCMEKVCEQCAQSRPLQLFRRFAGRKKIMRSVCNVCDPPRTLKQMTKRQRAGEVAHGRVNWLIVAAMERQEHDAYRNSQAGTSLLTQRRLRREAWAEAILTPLQKELTWAESMRDRYTHQLSLWEHPRPGIRERFPLHPDYGRPWLAFFIYYAEVLRRMLDGARAEYARAAIAPHPDTGLRPRNPTPEQADPCTYVFAHEIGRLRRLYAVCQPIPGRRTSRSPWLHSWEKK
jgi:hypothetical protein